MSAKVEKPNLVVARNICRLRNQRRFTQEKICELAEVDRGYFQQIEAGRKNATLDYLDRLRKALKCEWADLFRGLDKTDS